jgi:chemotaxis protein CheD
MPAGFETATLESKSVGAGQILVGMGQIAVARKPARLIAVLGSCVGVAMYDPRRQRGGLAHVVLPASRGQNASPGKFADTAVPCLLELLCKHGARPGELIVRITGGACMFESSGPLQIGEANIKAVLEALDSASVRPVAEDLGGSCGRRVALDCESGALTVEIAGKVVRKFA